MTLNLPSPITVTPVSQTATKLWVQQLVIRWGPGQSGTAKAELIPITAEGQSVPRDADGVSLMQSVDCPSMMDYIASGNCPAITTAMTEILKAVQQIDTENARLAAIEAESVETESLFSE